MLRVPAAGATILLALLLAAGCGADTNDSSRGGGAATTAGPCRSRAGVRALARLHRDVREIRRAADLPTRDTLKGNHAINVATDRFLHDVQTAPVDLLVRNRMIDHAVAALVGECEQCFQALEAERPIPAIKTSGRGAGCG